MIPRSFRHIGRLAVCCLVLSGIQACSKAVEDVPVHELTGQEQKKQHLEKTFSAFLEVVDLEAAQDVRQFVIDHSSVSLGLDGSIIYNLRPDGRLLMELRFRYQNRDVWKVDGKLYGGLELHGSFHLLGVIAGQPDKWEESWDIHVYDEGEDVATLGMEVYDLEVIPVFRFPDGTSYSITTLILVEPLVEFLLDHGLSTE